MAGLKHFGHSDFRGKGVTGTGHSDLRGKGVTGTGHSDLRGKGVTGTQAFSSQDLPPLSRATCHGNSRRAGQKSRYNRASSPSPFSSFLRRFQDRMYRHRHGCQGRDSWQSLSQLHQAAMAHKRRCRNCDRHEGVVVTYRQNLLANNSGVKSASQSISGSVTRSSHTTADSGFSSGPSSLCSVSSRTRSTPGTLTSPWPPRLQGYPKDQRWLQDSSLQSDSWLCSSVTVTPNSCLSTTLDLSCSCRLCVLQTHLGENLGYHTLSFIVCFLLIMS